MALPLHGVTSVAGAYSAAISDGGIHSGLCRGFYFEPRNSSASCVFGSGKMITELGCCTSFGATEPHRLSVSSSSLLVKPSQTHPYILGASCLVTGFEMKTNGPWKGARIGAMMPVEMKRASSSVSVSLKDSDSDTSVETPEKITRNMVVENWVPQESRADSVSVVSERLQNVGEATDEAVLAAMEGWDSPLNAEDVSTIISSLQWDTALPFFKWVKSQGYELNVVVYNALLGVLRTGRAWSEADKLAKQMIMDGAELDIFSYNILISCAIQCDAPEDSLRWFEKMQEAGCDPDEATYSYVAAVYAKLGRAKDALDLYERLRETGWKPDKVSFETMVHIHASAGNYPKAALVRQEMQDAGLLPEAGVYNLFIEHYASEGKYMEAVSVYEDMVSAGVKPIESTFCMMIDVYGRIGEQNEAFQLFTRFKKEKMKLNAGIYVSLIRMCSELSLVPESETIMAGMIGRGFKLNRSVYHSVINLYAKEGKIELAEKFSKLMEEDGFAWDVIAYSYLIRACGLSKDFSSAEKYFEKMLEVGLEPDNKCCGILLSLLSSCQTEQDRAIVVRCLQRSNPTLGTIVELLVAENLQLSVLEEQLRIMVSQCELDCHLPFVNFFTDFCWGLGKKASALQLMTLADSLNIYPGGLRTRTEQLWILHFRPLSFCAAQCSMQAWINDLRKEVAQKKELPETLVIETGTGKTKKTASGMSVDDAARLYKAVAEKLKQIGSPFGASPENADWLVASGPAVTSWLSSLRVPPAKAPVEKSAVGTAPVGP